jgi:hypothetical protein|nr:MAG TPA: hypothetical protein [Caudoviricetes sp.]
MNNLNIDNIEQLLKSEPSEQLLLKAIKGLRVEKKYKKSRWILIIVCCVLGSIVGIHTDTVIVFRQVIDDALNVMLALLGVIFTGYALLQAFMNKHMLLQLLNDVKTYEGGEKSRLQDINEHFVYLMLLYITAITFTLIIKVIMFCIPDNFLLFSNLIVNNISAIALIVIYFVFIGIILWRTFSFISTIFQLFNIYAVTRLLEMLDEEDF